MPINGQKPAVGPAKVTVVRPRYPRVGQANRLSWRARVQLLRDRDIALLSRCREPIELQ